MSPDGFSVLVRDSTGAALPPLEAQARGATVRVEAGGAGGVRLRVAPEPAATQVELVVKAGARAVRRAFGVGPPGSRIALKLSPPAPIKGQDTRAELTVEVRDASGRPDAQSAPPIVRANVGEIEGLERVGPGVYRGRYLLPDTRHPEVAVLAAFAAWPHAASVHGALGALRVPLASAVELPGRSEPNADTSVTIAGRRFGPVRSDGQGQFRIAVVVPPGHGTGAATAVDRLGNRRTSTVDLMVPPTDQLACVVNPPRLPADGASRARVLCATSDAFGNIATGARVQLASARGRLSAPREVEGGVVEWTLTAPDTLGADLALTATWRQGATVNREDLAVALAQGPAAKLTAALADTYLHQGYGAAATFAVLDAQGRPRPGAAVEQSSGPGALVGLRADGGTHQGRYLAPQQGPPGRGELRFRAWGPLGSAPAGLLAWAEAGVLWGAVVDPAGLPVAGQHLDFDGKTVVTGPDGCAALGPAADGDHHLGHAQWPGLATQVAVRDQGALVFPDAARPASPPAAVTVEVGPPTPVNVHLEVSGRSARAWVEAPSGEVLRGRTLAVAVSSGRVASSPEQDGVTALSLEGAGAGATLTVVDLATEVAAVAEVRP